MIIPGLRKIAGFQVPRRHARVPDSRNPIDFMGAERHILPYGDQAYFPSFSSSSSSAIGT